MSSAGMYILYQISLAWQSNSSNPGIIYPWTNLPIPRWKYPRTLELHRQLWDYPGPSQLPSTLVLFPGPAQLSVTCSTEKRKRAWYILSREGCRGREKGREDLIECRGIIDVPTHSSSSSTINSTCSCVLVRACSGSFFEQ